MPVYYKSKPFALIMEYLVKIAEKEYGPIDEEILSRWVEDGRVLPDSMIRNTLMGKWKPAENYSFLDTAFKVQNARFKRVYEKKDSEPKQDSALPFTKNRQGTEFRIEYLPERANIYLRFKAGFVDLVFSALIFSFCAAFLPNIASLLGLETPSSINLAILYMSFFLILLYFGAFLGVFAQTPGMWYYGLIIVRTGDDAGEVYLCRAFIHSVMICIFFLFSPLFNYILASKRSIHDFITDTQIVRISARKS